MSARPVVVVIGAGFSGLLTALHLLADPDGPQVLLLERRGVFGRGLAYSTQNDDHLLNVRAGNMSAFPDRPEHFVDWLSGRSGWNARGPFVTRGVYGDYLQDLLREAAQGRYGAGRLLLEADEAVGARRTASGWRVATAMGRSFDADAVVLALGAAAPTAPAGVDPARLRAGVYVADPWATGALSGAMGDQILLIGSGLTMVDVALSLARPGRRFTVLSRRGRLPTEHGAAPPAAPRGDLRGSPMQALRRLRRQASAGDWRIAIDEMRGSVQALWGGWTAAERGRFLRHLRPFWEAHRHRMAPPVARQIERMQAAGDLAVRAGAIVALRPGETGADLLWRPRGQTRLRHMAVSAAINCTGAQGDIRTSRDGLVRDLLDQGHMVADRFGLGAEVTARAQLLNAAGATVEGLFAVGPLTRGAFWEVTSVPDIRLQAAAVGASVLESLRSSMSV